MTNAPSLPLADKDSHSSTVRGIWLMIIAMQIAPMIDALAKTAIARVPSIEVVTGRFVVQTIFCLAMALWAGRMHELRAPRMGFQILRGVMLALTSLLFISALKWMPLVDAFAIAFIEPMLLTALSALVLKEKVGMRRWTACFVGFVGCVIVVRPNYDIFGVHALLPLGSAMAFALYHMMTRQLSGQGSVLAAQFISGFTGTLLSGAVLTFTTWTGVSGQVAMVPEWFDLVLIVGVGVCSLTSHALVIKAFQKAPAMVLAPLGYLEIIGGTIYGYFVFHDFPPPLTWLGIAVIMSSGIYILNRERIRARAS